MESYDWDIVLQLQLQPQMPFRRVISAEQMLLNNMEILPNIFNVNDQFMHVFL